MSNPNRFGVRGEGEKLTAEFTSGQLVIAICVSLFVALVCFLLGVLVGRYDRAHRLAETPAPIEETSPSVPVPSAPVQTGVQTSPRTESVETTSATQHSPWSAGRVRDMEPLPSPTEGSTELEKPVAIPKPAVEGEAAPAVAVPPAPSAEAAKPEVPATPPAPVTAPALAPGTPGTLDEPEIAMPPITATASTDAAKQPGQNGKPSTGDGKKTERTAGRGKFGIQVAAFQGGGREAAAQAFKSQLKSKEALDAEIVMDGQYARVIITGYKDKASAAAACAEFRKKPGLDKSFVRALPQP